MMKKYRIPFISFMAIFLFSLAIGNTYAATSTTSTTIKAPVILKINQYYVLYTSPDVPYIDKQNRFMIPLRAVSELIGATVSYDANTKKATVSWDGKTVEVTINSKNVTYNGAVAQIDTVPVLKQGQVFIPVKVVLDGLGLKGNWKDSLLTISDEKIKSSSKIISDLESSGIDSNNTPKGADINTNDIRPLSVEVTLPSTGANAKNIKLTVKAKNISGKDMPKGTEDLRPTVVAENGYEFQDENRARPAVKAGAIYSVTWSTFSEESVGQVKYILAVGKTVG